MGKNAYWLYFLSYHLPVRCFTLHILRIFEVMTEDKKLKQTYIGKKLKATLV